MDIRGIDFFGTEMFDELTLGMMGLTVRDVLNMRFVNGDMHASMMDKYAHVVTAANPSWPVEEHQEFPVEPWQPFNIDKAVAP